MPRNLPQTLLVGWDSEYDTTNGFTPISDQLYVLEDGSNHYLEHVGTRWTFDQVVEYIAGLYPEYSHYTLVTHYGRAELMALDGALGVVLGGKSITAQKTIAGTYELEAGGRQVTVDLRDTFLLTGSSLEAMGDMLGLAKLESHGYRERGAMLEWRSDDPKAFEAYAMRDAEVTVKFYQAFCNKMAELGFEPRMTIGSILDHAMQKAILGDKNRLQLGYRKKKDWSSGKPRVVLEPVAQAKDFMPSYYGGRNETYIYGCYQDQEVYDYDLVGAYSNVLATLPMWRLPILKDFAGRGHGLYNFMLDNPKANGKVTLEFRFKDDVLYPSLPVRQDGGLYFPRGGYSTVTVQEFVTAYPNLAYAKVHNAKVSPKTVGESPIAKTVSRLRELRAEAKKNKDTFTDAVLKLLINSGYGKFAQGLVGKKTIDLESTTRNRVVSQPVPTSKVTNPAIASYITGTIRAMMAEYLQYCQDQGITVASVTTDGFTTVGKPLPPEAMAGVGMYTRMYAKAIAGDILELKHQGVGLLSFKTRGYAMLESEKPLVGAAGISLRNRTDQERAHWLHQEFSQLTPYANTSYESSRMPSLRDWILRDATPENIRDVKGFNWDFDLKRKPIEAKDVDGRVCYRTVPFATETEATTWRELYHDYNRGKRDGQGRQVGTKNKLQNANAVESFTRYVALRQAQFTGIKRITNKAAGRLVAGAIAKANGYGFKKIAKLMDVPVGTVRHWLRDLAVSDEDLASEATHQALNEALEAVVRMVGADSDPACHPSTQSAPSTMPESYQLALQTALEWWQKQQPGPEPTTSNRPRPTSNAAVAELDTFSNALWRPLDWDKPPPQRTLADSWVNSASQNASTGRFGPTSQLAPLDEDDHRLAQNTPVGGKGKKAEP